VVSLSVCEVEDELELDMELLALEDVDDEEELSDTDELEEDWLDDEEETEDE